MFAVLVFGFTASAIVLKRVNPVIFRARSRFQPGTKGWDLRLLAVAAIALTAWAQAVNGFFEPGVRIQEERGQRVVSTGPYAYIRHPGYVAALVLMAGMALALGSRWAFAPAVLAGGLLVLRTSWEDDLLHRDLAGYADYAARVRWRLLPGIW